MQPLYRRAGEVDACFMDDLEFDQFAVDLQNGPDPILVGPDLARKLDSPRAYVSERNVRDSGTQRAITSAIGAKKIDVRGFAIFFQFQHDPRTTAKITPCAVKKSSTQGGKRLIDGAMADAGVH
jgi:hypothetical protein